MDSQNIDVSIVIACYNEMQTIEKNVSRIEDILRATRYSYEIILYDDGSTDGTRKKLNQITNIIKIFLKKNQGKGAAIRHGLAKVSGDYVLIQDADLEYDPQDISALLMPVLSGKAKVVYGSRFTGPHRNMLFWHLMGNKILSFTTNVLFNTTISDMEVGYKLIPTKLLKSLSLKSDRFGFEPEVTAKILKTGERIFEVPISYTGREFSEGKKITWKDGLESFYLLWKYRLA